MSKKANKQNRTYELANNKAKLTSEDKKILELAKKIEKGKNVVKKLKKNSNIQDTLMVEIVRKCEGQKETLAMLQHALLYGQGGVFDYIIKEAERHKLFEKIADKEIILERLNDHGDTIGKTYSTVVYEDGTVKRTTVAVDILTEIRESGEEAKNFLIETDIEEPKETYTLEDIEEELVECEEVPDVKNQSNNAVDQDGEIGSCENMSQGSENPQSEHRNSKDNQNTLKEQKSSIAESLSSEIYSKPCRENSEGENLSKRLPKSIVAGIVGAGLLASCVALYIMKMPVVAVALGIVGLTCAGFALYNLLKPKTKFEEMKDVEQHTTQPLCSLLCH